MTFVPDSSRQGLTNPHTPAQLRSALAKLFQALKEDKTDITNILTDIDILLAGVRRSGITGATTSVVVGDVVYLTSAGVIEKARANAISTGEPEGVITQAAAAGAITEFAPSGVVEKPGWGLTIGAEYYLSSVTAGAIVTAPDSETAGSVSIIIGTALSSDELLVNIHQSVLY